MGLTDSESKRELFISELSTLQRTEHQNLVKLIETLEDNHFIYLIMELVEGGDLQQRLQNPNVKVLTEDKAAVIIK